MKNKRTVKILSAICLASLGMVAFTGCSGTNQTQIDGLNNKIDALTQQVETLQNELDQTSQELKDYVAEQVVKGRAWSIYVQARANYLTNANGIRNNLVIETESNMADIKTSCYKKSNGDYTILTNIDDDIYMLYSVGESAYEYKNTSSGESRRNISSLGNTVLWNLDYLAFGAIADSYLVNYGILYSAPQSFEKENITNVEILPNGNYKMTFVLTNFYDKPSFTSGNEEYLLQTCYTSTKEITPEGKILSDSSILFRDTDNAQLELNTTFTYNTVDISEINSYIETANNTQISE